MKNGRQNDDGFSGGFFRGKKLALKKTLNNTSKGCFFFYRFCLETVVGNKNTTYSPHAGTFMVRNLMVESVKTCKNHRLNKQKNHMFFCFRAMLPFTFLTKCSSGNISMHDPAYSTEMFVWVTISLRVQRLLFIWSFRKDHCFSRELQSTIPGDYSFNGL